MGSDAPEITASGASGEIVAVPTFLVAHRHRLPQTNLSGRPIGPMEPEVFLQWRGKANGTKVNDRQFQFPITLPNALSWSDPIDSFQVIFLGKAKDWPGLDEAQEIADTLTDGDAEATVVWVITSELFNGPSPLCFVMPMTVKLAIPGYGIIEPCKYLDLGVIERELSAFEKRISLSLLG